MFLSISWLLTSTEVSVVTHVEGQSAVQSRSKCKDKLPGVRSCQARQTEVPRVQKDSTPSLPPPPWGNRCCVHECHSNSLWSYKTP